jgi:hypothetical protein
MTLRRIDEVVVTGDRLFEAPTRSSVRLETGMLLKFAVPVAGAPEEANRPEHLNAALWIWRRSDTEHVLMQRMHQPHVHRVHAVFWSPVLAGMMKDAIEAHGITDVGTLAASSWSSSITSKMPSIVTYVIVRGAGILPLPGWTNTNLDASTPATARARPARAKRKRR